MKRTLLFLAKGFETMEASVFIDVLGWARNDYQLALPLTTCGFTKTVVSTFGVPVTVDCLLDEVDPADYDALAIPGGFEEFGFYEEAYDERLLALIRAFDSAKKPIASICVAALALGKSGILQDRRATTYHLKQAYRQKQLAAQGAIVINEPVVVDDNVATSYCPSTAPQVAFWLLEQLAGPAATAQIKEDMGF